VTCPDFARVAKFRPSDDRPTKTISRVAHPTCVIAVTNLPDDPQPLEYLPPSRHADSSSFAIPSRMLRSLAAVSSRGSSM
jgi:hypothetical protein